MKTTRMIFTSLLLMVAGIAWGEAESADPELNKLTAGDVVIVTGNTAELHIGVINQMNVAEYGFRLYLPDGVTVEQDEFGYFYEFTNRHPKGRGGVDLFQMVIMETDEPGVLMFSAACPSLNILSGNEGDALIITLRASADVAPGEYTGRLGRIDLSNEDGMIVSTPADVTFKVTVSNATGINGISGTRASDGTAPRYSISGQRVGSDYRGVVIENGRKVIVK